jgi:hypothetical protein
MIGLATQCGFFTPGSSGFDVLDLEPELLYDSAVDTSLYDAASGGSLVSADGDVARWEDLSGYNRHATWASGTKPIRKVGLENGIAAVRFAGGAWMASVPFGGTETWETHMIVVSRQTQYAILAAWAASSFDPNPGGGYMAVNSGGQFECVQSGSGDSGATSSLSSNSNFLTPDTWRAVAEICGATHSAHELRVDGNAVATSPAFPNNPGSFTKTATAFGLGAWNNGTAPARCDINFLIHFNRHLTTAERTALDAYKLARIAGS